MALRSPHGHNRRTGAPRIEVLPPDELPEGIPADSRPELPTDRGAHGEFAPGNSLAARAGQAKAGKTKLSVRLSFAPQGEAIAPYRRAAASFRRAQCAELARTVGGGVCGPGPSSVVASAALALAWSRYLSDQAAATGDVETAMRAMRAAESSRQHLLAAHELCQREAKARAEDTAPAHDALFRLQQAPIVSGSR